MLKDLTLKITPELAEKQGVNFNAPAGHLGTHFDVMNKEFPLSYTRLKAVVFDVRGCGNREITCADISLDDLHEGMFAGFCTGFIEEKGYGTPEYHRTHPVLSYELIDALIEKKISIIGIDFAGVRRGKEHTPADQHCADHGVFIVENLTGLDQVIGHCVINTYPMNYAGVSGLPCRVIAETE